MKTISVNFPKIIVKIDLVGHNSLMGALCQIFLERDFMKDIGVLDPDQIEFVVKRVQPEVNLYDELNKVRDVFKIEENKISLLIGS